MRLGKFSLATYNGRDGQKAFIAYKGKVYDVSTLYKDGEHNSCIAGNDLTGILDLMPHGDSVLKQFPVVAELDDC